MNIPEFVSNERSGMILFIIEGGEKQMGSFKKMKNILIFILLAGILVCQGNSQVDYVDGEQGGDRNYDFNYREKVSDH